MQEIRLFQQVAQWYPNNVAEMILEYVPRITVPYIWTRVNTSSVYAYFKPKDLGECYGPEDAVRKILENQELYDEVSFKIYDFAYPLGLKRLPGENQRMALLRFYQKDTSPLLAEILRWRGDILMIYSILIIRKDGEFQRRVEYKLWKEHEEAQFNRYYFS